MTWHAGGISLVGHSGGYPGFTTRIAFAPKERLCAAVLTNAITPLAANGINGIYGSIGAVTSSWDAASATSRWHTRAQLASFGGIYRDNFGTLVVGRLNNALLVVQPEDVEPFADASLLVATGPKRFLVASGDDFGFLGEQVHFRTDRRGTVTTLVWGAHPFTRVAR